MNVKLIPNLRRNVLLAPYTTLKIGGPAEYFLIAKTITALKQGAAWARKKDLPLTILGAGSNVLISDRGLPGLTVINKSAGIKILKSNYQTLKVKKTDARWTPDRIKGSFKYDFNDLDYSEENEKKVVVELESGITLAGAMQALFKKGITGLQWYARIPGTVGGALLKNVHGGTHLISENLLSVKIMNRQGREEIIRRERLRLIYDQSDLARNENIILSAKFIFFRGNIRRARYAAREWSKRKSIQPLNSAGCAFANISQKDQARHHYPTPSVGYIVDKIVKLSGYRMGDAAISDAHKNFIVNQGQATARDYLRVMEKIFQEVRRKTGIKLVPEIFLLGFNPRTDGTFKN